MKIRFLPQNVEYEISPNQTVLQLAIEKGIFIKSVCKGLPSCAECRVRVVEGEHNVLTPASAELSLIGTAYFVDSRRLSCQLRCFGDITVDLSEQEDKRQNQGKRPRGKGPRDSAESFAVRGNMIDEKEKERIAAQVNVPLLTTDETEDEEKTKPGEGEGVKRRRRRRRRGGGGGRAGPKSPP